MHPTARRVADAAEALGLAIDVVEFPDGTRTAEDAARAVGSPVGTIVKSLVFLLDGGPVMALVAGDNRLDEGRLAEALGGVEVRRADADTVRQATGYAIGGVPPLGLGGELPIALDEDLLTHEVVWAAAGTPRHVFCVPPADLARATSATVARLAR